jgi:hypothetical protein
MWPSRIDGADIIEEPKLLNLNPKYMCRWRKTGEVTSSSGQSGPFEKLAAPEPLSDWCNLSRKSDIQIFIFTTFSSRPSRFRFMICCRSFSLSFIAFIICHLRARKNSIETVSEPTLATKLRLNAD